MTTENGGAARRSRLVWLLAAQTTLMVLLGLWVTRVAVGLWPLTLEDRLSQDFATHRSPLGNGVTEGLSLVASTEGIVGVTLLCVAALLALPPAPRWAEAVFLGASVAVQSAVFLVVTFFVERPRPDVPQLDGAPPTSSFPSGHVGASVALYGGLAVLVLHRARGPWRYLAAGVLLLVPPAVGLSRVYRGMHHPSDVLGGLLNGALTLLVVGSVFLSGRGDARTPRGASDSGAAPVPAQDGRSRRAGGSVVVVRHPHGCPDELAAEVRARLHRHGFTDQRWTSTSVDRPSGRLAEECAAGGVDLVVACGGDGTVRVCADVVTGTGIPLALVPCGTGNLLARNLDLPSDPASALDEALAGGDFAIDVGRVEGDGLPPTRFTVMAGAGFDAAMVRDASPVLKAHLGWAAYALSAARHLRDPRMRLSLRLDGGRRIRRRARMVVIGNVGALQAGLELLPRARPDSGRMEVVLFDPRGAAGWLAAAAHLAARIVRRPASAPAPASGGAVSVAAGSLEYFSAARIEVRFARAQGREVDGDTLSEGTRLTVDTEPGALRMRLPRAPGGPSNTARTSPTSRTAPAAPAAPAARTVQL
ncbi:diacylglycerol kinase family protein [Streptomyces virginiae]|uniref:diacylglycerol kinase family protein n=1 Tax=Streptomyces virginiae TaxID=1961 RepID=UPI002DB8598E|nr:diacylglycerol kinase family protein [Streptomyces sp. CMAA1738]MEC4573915.1 diacylglycerol kinase family protein [Streptomyces sp. CMAA1738]